MIVAVSLHKTHTCVVKSLVKIAAVSWHSLRRFIKPAPGHNYIKCNCQKWASLLKKSNFVMPMAMPFGNGNFGGHYCGNYIIKRLDQHDTEASDRQTRVTTTKDSYSALSTSILIWVSAMERYTWDSHRAVCG